MDRVSSRQLRFVDEGRNLMYESFHVGVDYPYLVTVWDLYGSFTYGVFSESYAYDLALELSQNGKMSIIFVMGDDRLPSYSKATYKNGVHVQDCLVAPLYEKMSVL